MKVGFQMPNEICLQTLFQAGCPWFTLPACNINSYVGKWTQLSEICAQFVHRSAVLNNERLVETFTRPSAAATLSIIGGGGFRGLQFRKPFSSNTFKLTNMYNI